MKCFDHAEEQAVGPCKHCSKGIGVTCTVDTGDGLACAGTPIDSNGNNRNAYL